jgi:uncharacterized protein
MVVMESLMDLRKNWPIIREIFRGTFNLVIASINEDGSPHISPIASIHLRNDCTGYYLERFPVRLPGNLEKDDRICVYAAKHNFGVMLKALASGHFAKPPAVRLYGRAGERRPVTDQELARWQKKVKLFRWSKGYEILWSKFTHARELYFDDFDPVDLGKMTDGLWQPD